MNRIQLVGQIITCTNYTTPRIFNFNPEPVRLAAETFLACGITEIEIPQGVLDPNRKCPETGVDEQTLGQTLEALPGETKVVGTYLSPQTLGSDNAAYLKDQKRALSLLIEHFPDMRYAMLHPAKPELGGPEAAEDIVATYAALADHAVSLRNGFQLCWHNHYDTSGETAAGVRAYLDAIVATDHPGLNWGPDIGHCHGMGDEYLAVFDAYAHLIGDFFHIKARVPAFDRLHGGEDYREERDIWSNKAEIGGGLYSGFVNVADPEVVTPFQEVFRIIREKARPTEGVVRGALEIDIPRQHPRLEVLCAALYLKNVHGVNGGLPLPNDEIIRRAFAT
jgi:sugar phosphate isomerase/epimerase